MIVLFNNEDEDEEGCNMNDYADAYINYLVEFHTTRDYFECHELLEDHWKKQGRDDPHAATWVGLIQLAVAQYHHRRGNAAGARKLLLQAIPRLRPEQTNQLGLHGEKLERIVKAGLARLEEEGDRAPYADMELPIASDELECLCRQRAAEHGLEWGRPSPMDDTQLIERHRLRDRSDVILARAEAAARREAKGASN